MFLAVALLFAGCRKPVPAEVQVNDGIVESPVDVGRAVIPSGGRWSGGGLCLDVPSDWDVRGSGNGVLGSLRHAKSGVEITVIEYGPSSESQRERVGFTLDFEDESAYRALPMLRDGGTRTWTSDAPGGPILKEWFGTIGTHRVHLEVLLPFGGSIRGTRAAEALLSGLLTIC